MKIPSDIKIYGDPAFRGACLQEETEQANFVSKVRFKYPDIAKCLTSVKNEGKRSHAQMVKDKKMGHTKGIPDILCLGSPAFVCEFKQKNPVKSSISAEQLACLRQAKENGAFTCIALGSEAGIEAFEDWIIEAGL